MTSVNITNNKAARAALALFTTLKAQERAGDAAKRARQAENGPEAILMDVLGDADEFVVLGNVVAKMSSLRNTGPQVDLERLKTEFPDAYAAVTSVKQYRFLQVL